MGEAKEFVRARMDSWLEAWGSGETRNESEISKINWQERKKISKLGNAWEERPEDKKFS